MIYWDNPRICFIELNSFEKYTLRQKLSTTQAFHEKNSEAFLLWIYTRYIYEIR